MKYVKLIFLLTFLSSCSTNKSVVGLYGKCGKSYFACTQIELKADKTFEYFIFMDVGGESVVKGTWNKLSNDTIALNTYNQPEIPKTTYEGKVNPELTGKVKIKISDKNGALGFANVQINDKKLGVGANQNGIAEFETESIKNVHYSFLGQEETIEIDNPNYNNIEVLIKDLDINAVPEFLTNYKIVVNGKKLIMDSEYIYKKTNLKNKQWK
ncbi:hypothetical protein G3567_13040 [Psychroflexus sp. YR1-1]|uniref:Lipoprotein n=1 Tax=Psychroflexus aurantiacus TaxID=2709310 RepID=A0A6B3R3T7_9FLAO|nr:hypothetical protein [Psychroflexus aurantiacus]NEV95063.1 hypothetical protein [Psychroflexus aurantiacus]